MVKLAIADPPYLRRSVRWYGGGPGHYEGEEIRADVHPEAAEWDDPARHAQLVAELCATYDGWAVAMAPDSLPIYLRAAPPDARVMVWHRGNAMPTANRVAARWEPVLIRVPLERLAHGTGLEVSDVLTAGVVKQGFLGAKPAAWTRWVLAALGYVPGVDDLTDLFPGSGAVARAMDGMLAV